MHDLRRSELAAYVGLSPTGLANILNSHSEPTLRTAGKMATAFGISLDELYGDLTRCLRAASVAFETAPVRSVSTRPPRPRLALLERDWAQPERPKCRCCR